MCRLTEMGDAVIDAIGQQLVEIESRQWQRLRDGADVEREFAEAFLSVSAFGVLTREEVLSRFRTGELTLVNFHLADFRVVRPTDDTVLLVYRADAMYLAKGERLPYVVLVSALWVRHGGTWQKAFFQSTPVAALEPDQHPH